MTKWICEKAKECKDGNCDHREKHEHDAYCESACDFPKGIPEAKCIIVKPSGVELIAEERKRQIEKEGWDTEHDDSHPPFSMAIAGACYALDLKASIVLCANHRDDDFTVNDALDCLWPWDGKWWKPTPDDPIRQLTKAGALIAAEIDRLKRLKKAKNGSQED